MEIQRESINEKTLQFKSEIEILKDKEQEWIYKEEAHKEEMQELEDNAAKIARELEEFREIIKQLDNAIEVANKTMNISIKRYGKQSEKSNRRTKIYEMLLLRQLKSYEVDC